MTENVSRTRDDLVARLRRAGELQVSGDNQAELDSYFDTRHFRFHGPDGFETDYAGLAEYFKAVRGAFDDRSIRRGIVVAEANYIACQTWIEGTFVREFTQSPAGVLAPNGQRVVWDLANMFRLDDLARAHTSTTPLSHQPSPGRSGGRTWWAHFEFTRMNIDVITTSTSNR